MIVPVEPRFMEAAGRTDQDFVEEKMDEREEMVKRGSYCAHVAWLRGWGCTERSGSCWLLCRCSILTCLWRCCIETRCRPLKENNKPNIKKAWLFSAIASHSSWARFWHTSSSKTERFGASSFTYCRLFWGQERVACFGHRDLPTYKWVPGSLPQTCMSGWCSGHTAPFPGWHKPGRKVQL